MRRSCIYIFIFLGSMSICFAGSPYDPQELLSGYTSVVDEQGKLIMQTGLAVNPGDEFIDEDNRVYEISVVEGMLAKARYIRNEHLITAETLVIPAQSPADTPPPLIAIYHSHNDESYIPTDGTATKSGNGSIMLVGESLATRLAELGLRVDHSKALHDPHDANAYQRSRRTFTQLLQNQPSALFDIHRDSAPLSIYKATINDRDVAKLLLVVGRQNQNRRTTMDFAKRIKAVADAKYKGLVRGIFIAHGNYNQDLNPRAILVEIGTQYNTLEQANRSAALFADIVPAVLNSPVPTAQASEPGAGLTNAISPYDISLYKDIFAILGILAAGIAAYLFVSTGRWSEAKAKLRNFRDEEFGDILNFRKKRR